MKKLCFVTTVPVTLRIFVLETAKFLHENGGFDISFICDYDEQFEKILPEYIHYYPVPMKRGISVAGIKSMILIKEIFKEQKFDMIQYSTPNASCYAALAGWLAKIPIRLYCQWGIAYVGFSGVKRKIFKLVEKIVCKLSTWVEPDSFGNLKFSHEEGLYPSEKGSVIWNGSASGVNLQKFDVLQKNKWRTEIRNQYSILVTAKVFVFVGRVTKDKGINELFAASKKIFEKYSDIYLLMVGENENLDSINHELLKWSQQEERVIYCGSTNAVEKYLAASDVYVLPSYREGFGSAVVEAEVMGLPVIVTDIPGPTDAMEKDVTGLVVKKGDAESLYEAMQKLYHNVELRKQMGAAAIVWASSRFEQKQLFQYICEDRKTLLGVE